MTNSPDEKPAKAKPNKSAPADVENSVSPAETVQVEPKPVPAPIAAPAPRHVYGKGVKDDVLYSRVRDTTQTRKSLTIKHLQRRLVELGFTEAGADRDADFGLLTERSVHQWQEKQGAEPSVLTPEQFSAIFEGDPNVNVVLD